MCGQGTTSVIVYNQLKGAQRQVHLDARQTEQGLACCELVTMSVPEVGTEITFLVRVYSGKWPRETRPVWSLSQASGLVASSNIPAPADIFFRVNIVHNST